MPEPIPQRRKRNSSKINLTFSIVFHTMLVLGIGFFAAREGMLGKQLKTLAVVVAPKEKKPEPPKPKPEEPKVEPAKQPETKVATTPVTPPPARVETPAAPPPDSTPAVAPEAVVTSGLDFSDGAREVQTGDAKSVYKAMVERALRARWNRPEDINDEEYVAEVELSITPEGVVTGSRWVRGSGDTRWDKSVKAAVSGVTSLSRKPPKDFPSQFLVRFDVETTRAEALTEVTSR